MLLRASVNDYMSCCYGPVSMTTCRAATANVIDYMSYWHPTAIIFWKPHSFWNPHSKEISLLLGVVQNLERQETELRWCNSDAMLADGMTKLSSQDRIRRFLEDNQQWNLRYDENFVAAKKRKKMPAEEEPGGPRDLTWLELLTSCASTNRGM